MTTTAGRRAVARRARRRPLASLAPRSVAGTGRVAEVMAANRAAHDRGDGPRDRQDRARRRSRGVRSHRLRPLGGVSAHHLDELAADGVRRRSASWSSPGPGTSRLRSRRAASLLRSPPATRLCSSRPPRPSPRQRELVRTSAGRRPPDVVQLVRGARRRRRSPPRHPRGRRRRHAHRFVRDGADVPRLAAVAAALRGDERQERDGDHRRRRSRPRRRVTSFARRSATPGRSARRRAWRSSRRRCTTTDASGASSSTQSESLVVGPAHRLAAAVGPLIGPPAGKLARALTNSTAASRWLVEPRACSTRRASGRPGFDVGVQPGSWFHRTECFGPVLGRDARRRSTRRIALQNASPSGSPAASTRSTRRRPSAGSTRVEVGNAYVNRGITGRDRAAASRSADGSARRSAGAPSRRPGRHPQVHDVSAALPRLPARMRRRTAAGGASCSGSRSTAPDCEPSPTCSATDRSRGSWYASGRTPPPMTCHPCAPRQRSPASRSSRSRTSWGPGAGGRRRGQRHALRLRLTTSGAERLRLLAPCDDGVRAACHAADIAIDETPVTHHGRVELPCWLRRRAISRTLHRHGHVPGTAATVP